MFSATFVPEIRALADTLLHDPARVQIERPNSAVALVRQVVHPVDRERKRDLLSHLVRSGRIDQALVFTRTKHGANRLAEQLGRDGITAAAIHGNKSQGQRVRALDDFKNGRVAILVATEVAARGLDIDGLPHVVNFELPMVPEDYVHRIGRTGRAGQTGDAVSLVCADEAVLLRSIERVLGHPIAQETVEGFAVDRSIRPEPIRLRSAMGGQGGRHAAPGPAGGRPNGGAPNRGRRPSSAPAGVGIGNGPARPGRRPDQQPRPGNQGRGRPDRRSGDFVALPGERFSGR
jgi:ATP-dependent RNA helicase RhlE